ncbi:MAG: hypothetical protein R3C03_15615 [Pirellulaceae bacterium]
MNQVNSTSFSIFNHAANGASASGSSDVFAELFAAISDSLALANSDTESLLATTELTGLHLNGEAVDLEEIPMSGNGQRKKVEDTRSLELNLAFGMTERNSERPIIAICSACTHDMQVETNSLDGADPLRHAIINESAVNNQLSINHQSTGDLPINSSLNGTNRTDQITLHRHLKPVAAQVRHDEQDLEATPHLDTRLHLASEDSNESQNRASISDPIHHKTNHSQSGLIRDSQNVPATPTGAAKSKSVFARPNHHDRRSSPESPIDELFNNEVISPDEGAL